MSAPAVTPWTTTLRRALTDGVLTLCVPLLLLFPWRPLGLARLARLVGLIVRRPRRLAEAQLQAALGCSHQAAHHLALECFAHLGRSLGELLTFRRLGPAVRPQGWIEGAGHLLQPLREGRPVVLLTAHLGNWELLGQLIASVAAQADASLDVIYRPLRQPGLNQRLVEDRAQRGIGLLARGPDTDYGQLQARLSKRPIILAFLMDQDLNAPGRMVPFFHAPAHTPTTPLLLAHDTRAALVTAFTWRDADGRHEVWIEPLPAFDPAQDATLESWVHTQLCTLHARLEARIRETPEQWVWFHARWRSVSRGGWPSGRPGGSTPPASAEGLPPDVPEAGSMPHAGTFAVIPVLLLALLSMTGCQELPSPVLDHSAVRIEGLELTQLRGAHRLTARAETITGQTSLGMAHERARASWLGGIGSLQANGVQVVQAKKGADEPAAVLQAPSPAKKGASPANPFLGAPLQLEADRMTGTLDGAQVELTGKVKLVMGEPSGAEVLEVRSDRLQLHRQEGRVVSLSAEGACRVTWQGKKARATSLRYLPEGEVLELRGSAMVEEPGRRLEADRILLGLADRTLTCEGCRVRWEGAP